MGTVELFSEPKRSRVEIFGEGAKPLPGLGQERVELFDKPVPIEPQEFGTSFRETISTLARREQEKAIAPLETAFGVAKGLVAYPIGRAVKLFVDPYDPDLAEQYEEEINRWIGGIGGEPTTQRAKDDLNVISKVTEYFTWPSKKLGEAALWYARLFPTTGIAGEFYPELDENMARWFQDMVETGGELFSFKWAGGKVKGLLPKEKSAIIIDKIRNGETPLGEQLKPTVDTWVIKEPGKTKIKTILRKRHRDFEQAKAEGRAGVEIPVEQLEIKPPRVFEKIGEQVTERVPKKTLEIGQEIILPKEPPELVGVSPTKVFEKPIPKQGGRVVHDRLKVALDKPGFLQDGSDRLLIQSHLSETRNPIADRPPVIRGLVNEHGRPFEKGDVKGYSIKTGAETIPKRVDIFRAHELPPTERPVPKKALPAYKPNAEELAGISKKAADTGISSLSPEELNILEAAGRFKRIKAGKTGLTKEQQRLEFLKNREATRKANVLEQQKEISIEEVDLDSPSNIFDLFTSEKGAVDIPNIKNIADKLKRKKTKLGIVAKDLVLERYGNIHASLVDAALLVKQIRMRYSPTEREAIPFMIEGSMKIPNARMADLVNMTKDYYAKAAKFLGENYDSVTFVDHYVSRVWDLSDPKTKRTIYSTFKTVNPHTKQRKIPSLEQGIKMGLKPLTTDVAELIARYDQYKVKVAANKRFVSQARKLTDEQGRLAVIDNTPINRKLHPDYTEVEHYAFRRIIQAGKTPKGRPILKLESALVHPDLASAIKVVLDERFNGKAMRTLETINAFAKKAELSISFFHHWTLIESAVSTGLLPPFGVKGLKMFSPRTMYNYAKNGTRPIFWDVPATKFALRSGLQLGDIPDVQLGRVRNALVRMEKTLKDTAILGSAAKKVRQFNDVWDKALWDYLHSGFKLIAFETIMERNFKRFPNKTKKAIGREAAGFVNDAFGGQVWDLMLADPKFRQMAQLTFLAPDWTLSQMRIATNALRKGVKGAEGRRYWLRTAVAFTAFTNIVNYALTKYITGEGRFAWDNTIGREFDIFIGMQEDDKGIKRERYLSTGKQFREPFHWTLKPFKTAGQKTSPILQSAIEQLTEGSTTGFPMKFKDKDVYDVPTFIEEFLNRAEAIGTKFVPFAIRGRQAALSFPTKQGITPFNAKKLYKRAIKDNDFEELIEISRGLRANNYDSGIVLRSAFREISFDQRREIEKEIRKGKR